MKSPSVWNIQIFRYRHSSPNDFKSHLKVLQDLLHYLGVRSQEGLEKPLGLVLCRDLQLRLQGLERRTRFGPWLCRANNHDYIYRKITGKITGVQAIRGKLRPITFLATTAAGS